MVHRTACAQGSDRDRDSCHALGRNVASPSRWFQKQALGDPAGRQGLGLVRHVWSQRRNREKFPYSFKAEASPPRGDVPRGGVLAPLRAATRDVSAQPESFCCGFVLLGPKLVLGDAGVAGRFNHRIDKTKALQVPKEFSMNDDFESLKSNLRGSEDAVELLEQYLLASDPESGLATLADGWQEEESGKMAGSGSENDSIS